MTEKKQKKEPSAKDAPEEAKAKKKAAKVEAIDYSKVIPGATVRVHQRIVEGEKQRTQVFEGMVLGRKGKDPKRSTILVRKISEGIGVEKIFPFALPAITKIEVLKQAKVRRSKLYYLRSHGKRLKETAVSS